MINVNSLRPLSGDGKKLFIETYGCQMNVGDSEIVVSIMQGEGYFYTDNIEEADELDPAWLEGATSVGICGATSTPKWLMEQVAKKIKEEDRG